MRKELTSILQMGKLKHKVFKLCIPKTCQIISSACGRGTVVLAERYLVSSCHVRTILVHSVPVEDDL